MPEPVARPGFLSSPWARVLVAVNALGFVALLAVALWLYLRPQATGSGTSSSPAGPTHIGRTPVFTVAPAYDTSPVLSPTQALFAGRVIDSVSQAPLAGAELRLDQAGGPLTVHTDALGRFQAAVETARPFGFTVDAPRHGGGVGFGRLCAGDRTNTAVALPPAGSAPSAPLSVQGSCR